jgi:hypothetical protein
MAFFEKLSARSAAATSGSNRPAGVSLDPDPAILAAGHPSLSKKEAGETLASLRSR